MKLCKTWRRSSKLLSLGEMLNVLFATLCNLVAQPFGFVRQTFLLPDDHQLVSDRKDCCSRLFCLQTLTVKLLQERNNGTKKNYPIVAKPGAEFEKFMLEVRQFSCEAQSRRTKVETHPLGLYAAQQGLAIPLTLKCNLTRRNAIFRSSRNI